VGRTGVVLREAIPWHQLVQVVLTAEETGYEAVFVPEIAGREAFSTLTGFALSSSRIRLGSGVVTVRSRSPVATAMAAATVQDVSGGRFVLGIGAGSATGQTGEPGPAELVARYVGLVRRILEGRPVDADEVFGTPAFRLDLPAASPPPPIWLGALGDRMVGVAGAVADGVLMNWCTPERVAAARRVLSRGAERGGRDPAQLTLAVYVRACLGQAEDVAMSALKEMAGRYAAMPHYRRQFELMGLGEEAALAAKAFHAGRTEEVPEPLVRAVAVSGGRQTTLARFREYREAGADLVLSYPVAALDPFSSLLGTVLGAAPSPSLER
jgi:alkanesulfonate monooxygenase SsuD/methylene tetrahydromethanopterin reductase-like flavin-dependent oxidoreductase (luciferase family)